MLLSRISLISTVLFASSVCSLPAEGNPVAARLQPRGDTDAWALGGDGDGDGDRQCIVSTPDIPLKWSQSKGFTGPTRQSPIFDCPEDFILYTTHLITGNVKKTLGTNPRLITGAHPDNADVCRYHDEKANVWLYMSRYTEGFTRGELEKRMKELTNLNWNTYYREDAMGRYWLYATVPKVYPSGC